MMVALIRSLRSSVIATTLLVGGVITGASTALGQIYVSADSIDTPGLIMDASVGWDSTVSQTAPLAVSFLIENQSTGTMEGTLSLHDPITGHSADLGEIFTGPVSTRRLSSVQDLSDWSRCVATLRSGRKVLWRRELILMTGSEFYERDSYALFIDDTGRRLSFGDGTADRRSTTDDVGLSGQSAVCLSAPAWQLPTHPGPLVVIQSIVFPDGMDFTSLNDGQWRAIARWVCLGGTVFVHEKSTEHVDQITKLAPLDKGLPHADGPFLVSRLGLGAIVTYSSVLFSEAGADVQMAMGERIARLSNQTLPRMHMDISYDYRQIDASAQNGLLVASFFGGYTLLSGLAVLTMFRRTRRQIAIWTIGIVILASVCAGALGAILRMSRGDLNWTTVTMAGEGGIVQVGRIEVKSAGGRDNQVAVQGKQPDLQFTGTPNEDFGYYRYYCAPQELNTQAFTWQSSLAANDSRSYQINVPMTPWGRRQAQVTDFARSVPRLDFELSYRSRIDNDKNKYNGEFVIKVTNQLPFDVADCQLVICAASKRIERPNSASVDSNTFDVNSYGSYRTRSGGQSYRILRLHRLSVGKTHEDSFPADFEEAHEDDWNSPLRQLPGRLSAPSLQQPGTVRAWIMGTLAQSPILEIDESKTEFVKRSSRHWFIQEVHSEDITNEAGIINDLTEITKRMQEQRSNGMGNVINN